MGFDDSQSVVALVGMDGFRLLAAAEIDGELHQLVETTSTVVGCPGCGTRAASKGRREVRVRDLSAGGRPVVVVWRKRIWRCPDPDCGVASWSEQADAIAPRASMTERARAEACREVGEQRLYATKRGALLNTVAACHPPGRRPAVGPRLRRRGSAPAAPGRRRRGSRRTSPRP